MFLYSYYWQYYIFMLPAILFVLIAQGLVSSRYKHFSAVITNMRVTGREAGEQILRENGVTNVSVAPTNGKLTDNFNPSRNIIYLSEGVYNSSSIAAIGIAAHEAGHAVQHAQRYFPAKVRSAIVPVCNIGANIGLPMCILGFIFSFEPLVNVGLMLFALATVFQLVTLPVEFNASRRALRYISSSDLYTREEYKGAKKVLTAAALTYVAALAQSLLQLLFYISRFSRRGD